MMNEQDSARDTRLAWEAFSTFSDHHLNELLNAAGVSPCQDRSLKLQQALMRWFGGFIPNLNELTRLAEKMELPETRHPLVDCEEQ